MSTPFERMWQKLDDLDGPSVELPAEVQVTLDQAVASFRREVAADYRQLAGNLLALADRHYSAPKAHDAFISAARELRELADEVDP